MEHEDFGARTYQFDSLRTIHGWLRYLQVIEKVLIVMISLRNKMYYNSRNAVHHISVLLMLWNKS